MDSKHPGMAFLCRSILASGWYLETGSSCEIGVRPNRREKSVSTADDSCKLDLCMFP